MASNYSLNFKDLKIAKFHPCIVNGDICLVPNQDIKVYYDNTEYDTIQGSKNKINNWQLPYADPDDILCVEDAYNGNYDQATHSFSGTSRGVDRQLAHEIMIEDDSSGGGFAYWGDDKWAMSDPASVVFAYTGVYSAWKNSTNADDIRIRKVYTKMEDLKEFDLLHRYPNLKAIHVAPTNQEGYSSTITPDMWQQAIDWAYDYMDNLNIRILSLQGESYYKSFTLLYKAHLPLLERLRVANHFYKINNDPDCFIIEKCLKYPTVKVLIFTGFRIKSYLPSLNVYGNWRLDYLASKFPSLQYLFINDCDTLWGNLKDIHTCWPNLQRICLLGCKRSNFTGTIDELNAEVGWTKYIEGQNIYIHYGSN